MAFARILALTLMTSTAALVAVDASAATSKARAPAATLSVAATVEHEGTRATATMTAGLGETHTITATANEHRHDMAVKITKRGDRYVATLGYTRDGKRIFKSKSASATGSMMTIDAGNDTTITISLAPTKPKRARIELPDGDDPLAGL